MILDVVSANFLDGGGEMGARMRAYDWKSSSLGPPEEWPQSLRVTLRLMLNSGHPMFIWWGPQLIQFYNDAYAETMGPERHPSALGARGRDCWDEIWHIIGPQVEYVLAGKGSTWNEDRLVPVTRHGRREDVWWTYSYGPIDLDGGVGGVLVVCNDVTVQHLVKEELKDRTRHLEKLFEQAPSFMAVMRGPDHVFELTNGAYKRLVGDRDFIGRSVRDVIPELEGQGFFELLDEVYQTGETHVGRRVPLSAFVDADRPLKDMYVDFVYQPIMDANGKVSEIFVEGVDVTDHVRAEEHLRLMNEELKHRGKNMLSVVSAIASQTFRGAVASTAMEAFRGRINAFGKAHDALTAANWTVTSVYDIVQGALAPHKTGEDRFSISGPQTMFGPQQALSLALTVHELATNAVKYGALSNDEGHVAITWNENHDGETPTFHFLWQEKDGPAVVKPSKKGFGSRLIESVLANDLKGRVEVSYDPSGLRCRIDAPMKNLASGIFVSPVR